MITFNFTVPQDPDPDMTMPLLACKSYMEGNPVPVPLWKEAIAKCRGLRSRHPEDPVVFHLSGVVAFLIENPEAAKAFCGQALFIEPGYADARQALGGFLESEGAGVDVDAYMEKLGKGVEFLRKEYLDEAHRLLGQGKPPEADRFIQKACAVANPEQTALDDYATCVAKAENLMKSGRLGQAMEQIVRGMEGLWGGMDEDGVLRSVETFDAAPDRKQFAALVCDLIESRKAARTTVFELGCFAGFNLNLVKETLGADAADTVSFYGLEPNETAVAYCRKHYPFIRIHRGTHRDMMAPVLRGSGGQLRRSSRSRLPKSYGGQVGCEGRAAAAEGGAAVPVPERVDICLVSRVFQVLHPRDVAVIMGLLAERADCLVICDDILNLDGDYPVPRGTLIILHEFRKVLDKAGFTVDDVVFAEVPDRACTGFIVARNRA